MDSERGGVKGFIILRWDPILLFVMAFGGLFLLGYFYFNYRLEIGTILTGLIAIIALFAAALNRLSSKQQRERLDRQISQTERSLLSDRYEERLDIINDAIETTEQNIERLSGNIFSDIKQDSTSLENVVEISELEPVHQEYFRSELADLEEQLSKQEAIEESLLESRDKARPIIEQALRIYLGQRYKGDNPSTSWLTETILNRRIPNVERIREEVDLEYTEGPFDTSGRIGTDIQITIDRDKDGSGIFTHEPYPSEWTEYLDSVYDAEDYFESTHQQLSEIRKQLMAEGV